MAPRPTSKLEDLSSNTLFHIVTYVLNLIHYFKIITTKEKPIVSYAVYLHLHSTVTESLSRPLKHARTEILWSRCLTNCLHASKRGETLIDDIARKTLAISGPQSFRYTTCLWDLITPRSKKIRFVNDVVKPASQVIN